MEDQSSPQTGGLKENLGVLEKTLEEYFGKKAPQLPANIKELIVNFAPWLAIISVLLAVPVVVAVLGVGSLYSRFMYFAAPSLGATYYLALVFLAISAVIELAAVPGLFKKKMSAWRLMFYGVLVNAVYQLVSLNIVSLVISALISLYILFQVKEYYK